MTAYLPGPTGRRITELRENRDMTIEELAARIGVNATTLGRVERGQTQKVGSDVLVALAQEFSVSTDYLLGLTDLSDRKNYDICRLGLSVKAIRNLYTRKVNAEAVSRMLEQPRFAVLSAMMMQYLDDTFAAGVAAQNQLFDSLRDILLGVRQQDPDQQAAAREAAQAVSLAKVLSYQVELTKMQELFVTMLKEMKLEAGSDLGPDKAVTKKVVEKMMAELTEGQDTPLASVTPEQITDAIIHTVDSGELDPEKLDKFRRGLVSLFEALTKGNHTHDAQLGPSHHPGGAS